MYLIDSHCHIDGSQFDEDRDEVVRRAKEAGVAAMLNVGTGDPHSDDFRRAVSVAERYDNVFASVGVHPHDAKLYDDRAEEHLIDLVKKSEKVVAWGEIGLDYYYDHSPRDVQQEVFRRQIRIAKRLGLPIIIHSRDADDDTVKILTEEYAVEPALQKPARSKGTSDRPTDSEVTGNENLKADSRKLKADSWNLENSFQQSAISRQPEGESQSFNTGHQPSAISHQSKSPGVMHCFGGTPEMAGQCLELGFYISFAGNVTFKKAEELRDAARVVPLDRLLVETDCPYLTPVPFRGKRNEPAYVVHTARFLAEFYGIEFEKLAEQTTKNFLDLFRANIAIEDTESS
ncbi:MAG: TatD family hydrolase [Acidobacteria bacterium]|nr:TatD family hydrolase [Acidobacteriota bacterium]